MNTCVQQICIKLIRSDSKNIYNVTLKTILMAAENLVLPSQE